MAQPGWGAKLDGHQNDLLDWCDVLHTPFEPWVERIERENGEIYVLRSAGLDGCNDYEEVRQRAGPLIERLNGALALERGTMSVLFDGAVKIADDGSAAVRHFVTASVAGRSRVSFVGVALGRDGHELPAPPPSKSEAQRWTEAAESDDDLADLLAHIARADNWYDLYKTAELAECIVGGEHALARLLGDAATDFKAARTTANFYRHARGYRPRVLLTLGAARAVVIDAAKRVLVSKVQ